MTTSENLMAGSTEEQLTLFAGGSRASRTAMPGSNEARQMTVTSGRRCFESFGKWSRVSSLARMFLASSAWNSTKCFLTWKHSATPAGRLLFLLRPSMPTTDETDCGFLAAATANQTSPSMLKHPGVRRLMWPTPTTMEMASAGKGEAFVTSSGSVRRKNSNSTTSNLGLSDAAKMWPTATATAAKGSSPASLTRKDGRSRKNDRLDHAVMAQHGGQLNPAWVEWLMGFPPGWTDLHDSEPLETPSSLK